MGEELTAIVERGGMEALARELPESWLDDFAIAGDPDECAAKIRRYLDAGGDSVVVSPVVPEAAQEMLKLAAEEILPRL